MRQRSLGLTDYYLQDAGGNWETIVKLDKCPTDAANERRRIAIEKLKGINTRKEINERRARNAKVALIKKAQNQIPNIKKATNFIAEYEGLSNNDKKQLDPINHEKYSVAKEMLSKNPASAAAPAPPPPPAIARPANNAPVANWIAYHKSQGKTNNDPQIMALKRQLKPPAQDGGKRSRRSTRKNRKNRRNTRRN